MDNELKDYGEILSSIEKIILETKELDLKVEKLHEEYKLNKDKSVLEQIGKIEQRYKKLNEEMEELNRRAQLLNKRK